MSRYIDYFNNTFDVNQNSKNQHCGRIGNYKNKKNMMVGTGEAKW